MPPMATGLRDARGASRSAQFNHGLPLHETGVAVCSRSAVIFAKSFRAVQNDQRKHLLAAHRIIHATTEHIIESKRASSASTRSSDQDQK